MAAAALGLVLAGLVLLGGPALMQDRLLYFPARVSVAQATADGLEPWPSAQDFRGLLAPAPATPRGTAIVFHGNAGHAGQRGHLAAALAGTGLRVILAEYPGYGPRDGALGEASLVADAADSIALARQQFGPPLLVVGESLGAGVAAAAAARQRDAVAGLMLITPWDRLEHVASFHYPWLPVKWLLRDQYDSAAHLAALRPAGGGGGGRARRHRAAAVWRRAVPCAARAPAVAAAARGRPQRLARPCRCRLVAAGGGFHAGALILRRLDARRRLETTPYWLVKRTRLRGRRTAVTA